MEQVPEGKKRELSHEEQLAYLRAKLVGNRAFQKCKGQFSYSLDFLAKGIMEESDSPTNFLKRWDEMMAAVRVMLNLFQQLKRDGMSFASGILLNMLSNKSVYFPGEHFPEEETEPLTILMLEPEKTMSLIRLLFEMNEEAFRQFCEYERWWLFENKKFVEQKIKDSLAKAEIESGFKSIINSFSPAVVEFFNGGIGFHLRSELDFFDNLGINFSFGFRSEQSEVLKHFTREEQRRIATWQIRPPKDEVSSPISLGVHPEANHSKWQTFYPSFASFGVSHNLGVVVIPSEFKTCVRITDGERGTVHPVNTYNPYGIHLWGSFRSL